MSLTGKRYHRPAGYARQSVPLAAALLCALVASGCSVSFPIVGLSSKSEDDVVSTASLPSSTGMKGGALGAFASELGPEDMRRANASMAVALDPQGNGAAASWDNPQSGMKGSFTPVGMPFLNSDEICRAFIAQVALQSGPRKIQGTACRPTGGEWAVRESQPWKGV